MDHFSDFPHSDLRVVAPDATIRSTGRGIFAANQITVFDTTIQVFVGDEIRRTLPNGSEEAFEVIDPQFNQGFDDIPSNFTIVVRRKGMFEAGRGGNFNIHVSGSNARVNLHSSDYSTNVVNANNVFGDLASAVQNGVPDEDSRLAIIQAIAKMSEEEGKPGFKQAYRDFMGLAADHLGVILPFLPVLAGMLPG